MPDMRALSLLARMIHKKDDSLLRAVAEELESEGITVRESTLYLDNLLAQPGVLTRRKPTKEEQQDIEFGWQMAKEIGKLDIGQTVVVKDQAVLAVEAIEGTDEAIRRGGRLCGKGAVVVKICKPQQDLRFDLPAVGTADDTVAKRGQGFMPGSWKQAKQLFWTGTRSFLKRTGQASVLSRVKQNNLRRNESSTDKCMKKIKVGVVGVGYLGRFHAEKYAAMAEVELVGVVDADAGRAQEIAAKLNTRVFAEPGQLLGRVDAVSVVVPTVFHHRVALEFLRNGVHVLLEKPITVTTEQADELIAAAGEKQLTLQIGHIERFNPAVDSVKTLLKSPTYMTAERAAPFTVRCTDVNVVLDLMIHDLDIVCDLSGSAPKEVSAAGASVITQEIDIATARITVSERMHCRCDCEQDIRRKKAGSSRL